MGRVGWFPRQDVPCGCIFGPASGCYRREAADRDIGILLGAHQAGGHQHGLSRGCKSGRDPVAGGELGASWCWFWQEASARGGCLPPSPLVTGLCGITLLIKASYSRFIKKLYSALARRCIWKWGDAQTLIETSQGSSARDPCKFPVLGGSGGLQRGWRVLVVGDTPQPPPGVLSCTQGLGRSHGAV